MFLDHPVYWNTDWRRNVLYRPGRYITETRSYARRDMIDDKSLPVMNIISINHAIYWTNA